MISYISALPGSGKTHWAIQQIMENRKKPKSVILYVAPTRILIDSVQSHIENAIKMAKRKGVGKVRALYSTLVDIEPTYVTKPGKRGESTLSQVYSCLKDAKRGDCVLITHATFIKLASEFEGQENVRVFFDEACDMMLDTMSVNIGRSLVHIEKMGSLVKQKQFIVGGSGDEINKYPIYEYRGIDEVLFSQYIGFDDCESAIKKDPKVDQFLYYARNERTKLFMVRYLADKDMPKIAPNGELALDQKPIPAQFIGMVSDTMFDGFNDVTILCAYFESTLMYHVLSKTQDMENITRLVKVDKERLAKLNKRLAKTLIVPIQPDEDYAHSNSKHALLNYYWVSQSTHLMLYSLYVDLKKQLDRVVGISDFIDLFGSENGVDLTNPGSYVTSKPTSKECKKIREILANYNLTNIKTGDPLLFPSDVAVGLVGYINSIIEEHQCTVKDKPKAFVRKILQTELNKGVTFKTLCSENRKAHGKTLAIYNNGEIQNNVMEHFDKKNLELTFLSSKCHGLNEYSGYANIISLAALYPKPDIRNFYTAVVPQYDTQEDWMINTLAQCVYRTSLRDPESEDFIVIIVPNILIARSLQLKLKALPILLKHRMKGKHRVLSKKFFVPKDFKQEYKDMLQSKRTERFLKARALKIGQMSEQEKQEYMAKKREESKKFRENRRLTATDEDKEIRKMYDRIRKAYSKKNQQSISKVGTNEKAREQFVESEIEKCISKWVKRGERDLLLKVVDRHYPYMSERWKIALELEVA